jgi:transcriptional regulator with XRE-family HTH domain
MYKREKIMPVSDNEILDRLKKNCNFHTDIELAGYLGLTRSAISMIRQGQNNLGAIQRMKILDHIGFMHATNWSLRLSPPKLAGAIKEKIQSMALATALPAIEEGESNSSDRELLDLVKVFTGCSTDAELAPRLGLKRTTLSMVRQNKARFGLLPRVHMLRMLEEDEQKRIDIDIFENAIQSSDVLLKLLHDAGWGNEIFKDKAE